MPFNIHISPPRFSKILVITRTFLGPFYVLVPHGLNLLIKSPGILQAWGGGINDLREFGQLSVEKRKKLTAVVNYLGNFHLIAYNMAEPYPSFDFNKQRSLFQESGITPKSKRNYLWQVPISLGALILFFLLTLPLVLVGYFIAFWHIVLTGFYPIHVFAYQKKHLEIVLGLLSKVLLIRE